MNQKTIIYVFTHTHTHLIYTESSRAPVNGNGDGNTTLAEIKYGWESGHELFRIYGNIVFR